MSYFRCDDFTDLDKEIIDDFYVSFHETLDDIESICRKLNEEANPEEVHNLFRAMHSLKGNCRMVFLDPLVETCHKMEEIVQDLREGRCEFEPIYGEFLVVGISKLEDLINDLINEGQAEAEPLQALEDFILEIKQLPQASRPKRMEEILNELAGVAQQAVAREVPELEINQQADQLAYFYSLALKLDGLSLYKRDRVALIAKLCNEINQQLGSPLDKHQLTAAVYLKDLGMAFIPRRVLQQSKELGKEDSAIFYDHTRVAAGLLRNIPGWEDAAIMVDQHHERLDGSGKPAGLAGDDIHIGAMILAVVDAYQEVLHQHSEMSFRKTLLKAVTEVNSEAGTYYSPKVVDAFNLVIRHHYISH